MSELILKWGTIKGWSDMEGPALEKLKEFAELGMSVSAMTQEMTPAHKEKLCEIIDLVDEIYNDWTGKKMNRDEAKKYVCEYRQN